MKYFFFLILKKFILYGKLDIEIGNDPVKSIVGQLDGPNIHIQILNLKHLFLIVRSPELSFGELYKAWGQSPQTEKPSPFLKAVCGSISLRIKKVCIRLPVFEFWVLSLKPVAIATHGLPSIGESNSPNM